ncbi:MAG: adenylate/guanylate cyclase domain-containing protein, partial [Desulfovibrionaceae bacterium]
MLPRLRLPLHVILLTLIATLLLAVVLALALFNYHESKDAAIDIAGELLGEVNHKVLNQVDKLFLPVLALSEEVVELPGLSEKPALLSHPVARYLMQALESYPQLYSAHLGFADGDFFQVICIQPEDYRRRLRLAAPRGARFAVRRILMRDDGVRVEIWKFLDSTRRIVGSRTRVPATFDPRERPWYREAAATERRVVTAPYIFASNSALGFTVSRRFDGPVPGVFGADVTVEAVCEFLARQHVGHSGEVLLFDNRGRLLAHPDPAHAQRSVVESGETRIVAERLPELDNPLLQSQYMRFLELGAQDETIPLDVDGVPHIARITPVQAAYMPEAFVAVAAPVADFTGTLVRTRNSSLWFAFLVLTVTLPVVLFIARSISSALGELARESDEIRHFRLETPVEVSSMITEVHRLAQSVRTMKTALRTFGQYVPRSLVRQIVRHEVEPALGGKRRELTLLFTDVADFTSISESTPPRELMLRVSDYFQRITSIFLANGGTIDKFIGDAVMAFWNAPTDDPDHVRGGCLTALEAAYATNALCDEWVAAGQAPFFTRFGLHTGECIVGNVGSADRMNYTAVGRAVNLASRLEGLNKRFGTQILVSATVRYAAREKFLFRSVGQVQPKGTHQPMEVYTLDASLPGAGLPHPATPEQLDLVRLHERG